MILTLKTSYLDVTNIVKDANELICIKRLTPR